MLLQSTAEMRQSTAELRAQNKDMREQLAVLKARKIQNVQVNKFYQIATHQFCNNFKNTIFQQFLMDSEEVEVEVEVEVKKKDEDIKPDPQYE
jgi:hypothetical protein